MINNHRHGKSKASLPWLHLLIKNIHLTFVDMQRDLHLRSLVPAKCHLDNLLHHFAEYGSASRFPPQGLLHKK